MPIIIIFNGIVQVLTKRGLVVTNLIELAAHMNSIQVKSKTFSTVRQVITVTTVLCYIIYSVIKRFGNNPEWFWMPFVLVCANILFITSLFLRLYSDQALRTSSNIRWLAIQAIINVGLAILIFSYIK